MKYKIFYPVDTITRISSVVRLEDYREVGEIDCASRASIGRLLSERAMQQDHQDPIRHVEIGDVLLDELDQAWIFTPSFVWAQVGLLPAKD